MRGAHLSGWGDSVIENAPEFIGRGATHDIGVT
jgi:hypothetical protein